MSPPVATPAARPTRVRYGVMAFLCALAFLTYFDRVCIVRAQPDIMRDLHLDDGQIGWVLGAFWFAYAVFEIPAGWLGDRYGARRSLSRIVLGWSFFTALSGVAVGFSSLVACRFLFGVGEAGAFPNMARVQARWLPTPARARAGGLLWLVARWGGAFSGVIVGAVLRFAARTHLHVAPWRVGFYLSGLVGLLWCVGFLAWFRDDPADKPSVNDAELALLPREPARTHLEPTPWAALFRSGSLWALGTLYFCGSFGWSFFVSWMPRFFKDVHGVSFSNSEWLTTWPLFFGGLACLAGGFLSDALVRATGSPRVGRMILPVLGCLTAAGAMFAIRATHSPHVAVAWLCVAATAYDLGQASNWASILSVGGRHAGIACGLVNTLSNLANAVQPRVGAAVFTHYGFGPLFGLYGGAYLLAASTWLFIDPARPFDRLKTS